VFDLATSLGTDKFNPSVAFGTSGKLYDDLKKADIKTYEIRSLGRDIALFSDITSLFQIIRCVRNVRPDILHLNSSKAAALGALAGRLSGVPRIIFTVHGWPFKEDRNLFARLLIRFICWFTALLSHAVIVVSKTDENIGHSMPFVSRKIHYIPIGIESPQFLSREEAAAALSIRATTPRIVTIAELTPNKGIRYAIEAIAQLKKRGVDVSYFIIGDGEERKTLEKLVRENGIADHVQFLGFVPDASQYLKAFDVFVLPSIKEGMPYVLFEATSAKIQIITTEVVDSLFLETFLGVLKVAPSKPSVLADTIVSALLPDSKTQSSVGNSESPLAEMVEKTAALY
jgi:glycosyltransferase involved in cell wall biosynthesis